MNETVDETVAIVLGNRHFLYEYCARAFAAPPDVALLGAIDAAETPELLALLESEGDAENPNGGQTLSALHDAIREAARQYDDATATLAAEYTRLFIGPGKLPAAPWESIYACGEPVLFQESTLAVREAYRAAGFQAAGYPHEPDDHVATELSFMAALAKQACEAYAEGDAATERLSASLDAQRRFLDEHLLLWIGKFSDRLNAQDGISCFYPSFAALAALVCERDRSLIDELLAAVR